MDLDKLESTIGVNFRNKDLLKEALTHRSFLNESPNWDVPHNERLEYLGDAVLELAISEDLFKKFSDFPEGKLTVLRAALVNWEMLARVASEMGLDSHVLMSRGERGDTNKAKEVILANAVEALIGAVYLDQGFAAVKKFAERFILSHLGEVLETKSYKDAKSELQEIIQERLKITPTYKVLEESGPAHDKTFKMGVYLEDKLIAEGVGSSKQEAEIEAAKVALERYKNEF